MADFDKLNMGPKWYIIYTVTGHENKVKNTIEKLLEARKEELSDLIFTVVVPTKTVTTTDAKGREKIVEEKLYSNYVFVKMVMNNKTWHIIRYIPGVASFVGPGGRPEPIADKVVSSFLEVEEITTTDVFEIGDEVEIIDGILNGHSGRISEISDETGEVTVIVSSIGREMPVSMNAKCIKKKN